MNNQIKSFLTTLCILIGTIYSLYASNKETLYTDKILQQEYVDCLKVLNKYKSIDETINSLRKDNVSFILLSLYNEDWGAYVISLVLEKKLSISNLKYDNLIIINKDKIDKILKNDIFFKLKPFTFFSGGQCSFPIIFYRLTFFVEGKEYDILLNQTKINKFNRESQKEEYMKFIKSIEEICNTIDNNTILENIYYP